jgi:hexosaminidase
MSLKSLCLVLIFTNTVFAQKNPDEVFKILPSPKVMTFEGFSLIGPKEIKEITQNLDLPKAETLILNTQRPLKITLDKSANEEAYSLTIKKNTIAISAKDKIGVFYALQTLKQFQEDADEQDLKLPRVSIQDSPLLSYRSVHLDVKHHLEKSDYYFDLIDQLAALKINGIIAEVEDKLAYQTHPIIGSADAMTMEQWIALSEYANNRNISISPLIQGLGHASFILKHEEYKHLRDDLKSDWAFNPLDPETYELQFDLYRDAIKATPHGKYLHIGGDEVHTTGRNSGQSSLELQLIWLNKVCAFAAENNRIPIFWDDMPLKYANLDKPMFDKNMSQAAVDSIWAENEGTLLQFLDQFPKNCIYMRWNYSHAESLGNTKAMKWFTSHGLQVMGATAGQTRWALMPSEESNMHNIRAFAKSSIEQSLTGLLLTLWDDDSPHIETYKRGIFGFAESTWAGEQISMADFKANFRQRAFSSYLPDEKHAFIDQLEKKVRVWENTFMEKGNRRYLRTNKDAKSNFIISMPENDSPGKWTETYAKRLEEASKTMEACENIAASISFMKTKVERNLYTLEVYEQINELVKFTAKSLLSLKKYDGDVDKSKGEQELRKIDGEFKQLRNKLEDVYGKARILEKPKNYILDQDHHAHMGNQSKNFDWQFGPEMLFLEKLDEMLDKEEIVN